MEGVTNTLEISSVPGLDVSPEGDFFRIWAEFTRPLHHLTSKEMDVLAAFLKKRYELSKVISDRDTLDKVLMSEETKREIRISCGVTTKHLQVIMSRFRKTGTVRDGRIHMKLIPNVKEAGVGLMIYFNFRHEERVRLDNKKGGKKTGS